MDNIPRGALFTAPCRRFKAGPARREWVEAAGLQRSEATDLGLSLGHSFDNKRDATTVSVIIIIACLLRAVTSRGVA